MSTLADIFAAVRLQLDGTGFEAQATALADKSGKNVGDRMSSQLNSKLKSAVGGAIGAGVGIALEGANQLDAATRQLQADAGLTADEATKAEHAMAGMYRNNLQGFDAIGAAMAKVRTDMGLTGDEADKTAALFLKFSTATGVNAADAVAHMDDILDLFHLKASDAETVLNKLVVSHQKYGTNVTSSMEALVQFGPALEAANLNIDDGIALLNLFEKAGVAPEKIATAFAKALKAVKSPEELKKLIADIGATQDPFERAQKAIALFGNRAGPQLAAALAKSGGDLSQFQISIDEATGAVTIGAKAVEDGFGARFTLLLHNAGGALAEFGTNFGPLVMLASVAGPKTVGLITTGLGALIGGLAKAGPVVKAATLTGTIIGGIYETAWLKAAYALDAIKGAIAKIATSGPIGAAAATAGGTVGEILGAAASAGMLTAIALGVIMIGDRITTGVLDDVGRRTAEAITSASEDALLKMQDELQRRIDASYRAHVTGPALDKLKADLAAVDAALKNPGSTLAGEVGPAGAAASDLGAAIEGPISDASARIKTDVTTAIDGIITYITGARSKLTGAASEAGQAIYGPIIAAANLATTQRAIAETKALINSKTLRGQDLTDAQLKLAELESTEIENLASLASYGDQAATTALESQIAVLSATKNLSTEQRAELAKLTAALDEARRAYAYLIDAASRTPTPLVRPGQRPKAFAVGTRYVDMDQLALIHRGEAVLPAAVNPWNPRSTGAALSAGLTVNGLTVNVSGVGSDVSISAARQFGATILDTVAEGLREQRARFVGAIP